MPSWNEKPVSIPEINVNLERQCPSWCPKTHDGSHAVEHAASCYARPVPIPCPIPRSVALTVTLGECDGRCAMWTKHPHRPACPAHPIRVTCSISGETWAGSEVTDIEPLPELWGINANLRAIARDRWALVKSLVLGKRAIDVMTAGGWNGADRLLTQRDAVFAALCEMARAEEVVFRAQVDAQKAFLSWPSEFIPDRFMDEEPHSRPSASILARYVEHLIEQVGVLGVAS